MTEPLVTVVIPTTGDRPSLLPSLDAVARARDVFGAPTELLVVWSGRTARPAWATVLPARAREVFASRLGLSLAKNVGLEAARAPLVAFIDDDSICAPAWISALHRGWTQGAALVGGPVRLVWPHGRPSWSTANAEAVLGRFTLGDESRDLVLGEGLIGTNMALDRSAAATLGGFDETLGHGSGTGMLGEDNELCARALLSGLRVRYEPGALVEHRLERSGATRRAYISRMFHFGKTLTHLSGQKSSRPVATAMRRMAKALLLVCSAPLSRERVESLANASWLAGYSVGLLGRDRAEPD